MSRFKPLGKLILIECAALVLVLGAAYLPLGCPFKLITGLPCPGCGGTRALFELLHGHFLAAIYINPLSVLLVLFALIAPLWLFIDCYRGTETLKNAMTKPWPKWLFIVTLLIIIANWIWNIYKGL